MGGVWLFQPTTSLVRNSERSDAKMKLYLKKRSGKFLDTFEVSEECTVEEFKQHFYKKCKVHAFDSLVLSLMHPRNLLSRGHLLRQSELCVLG